MADRGLVLFNAKIFTLEKDLPLAEALVTGGDRILYVGARKSIPAELLWGKETIDLAGRTVLPGFVDSHVHLVEIAKCLLGVDLAGYSRSQTLEALRQRVSKSSKGEWIIGYNWDESRWEDDRYITLEELDGISTCHPILLKRICQHLATANSLAFRLSGLTKDTEGVCMDSHTGRPIGLVEGEAKRKIEASVEFSMVGLEWALEVAQKKMLGLGITSIHHMGSDSHLVRRAYQEGRLLLRTYLCLTEEEDTEGLLTGQGDVHLRIGAAKLFIDGSLGAHSAALQEPYADRPQSSGRLKKNQGQLNTVVKGLHEKGWQIALHAIGDRAVGSALEALEYARERCQGRDSRDRIEHCELLPEGALERLKGLGLVVSTQPNFIAMWGMPEGLYQRRLGLSRWGSTNPLASFLRASIPVAFGSDGMPLGPLFGIWAAVNHPEPDSRISPLEAIYCYTRGGAYASFEEGLKGTISPGKLADLVVLSDDPTTISRDKTKDIEVEMTILGGRVLHDALRRAEATI